MEKTINDFNVLVGAVEHAISKGAFTMTELKQLLPAVDGLKAFIEAQASPSTEA